MLADGTMTGPRATTCRAPQSVGFAIAILAMTALLALPGCVAVGPDYTPPEPTLPDAWNEAATDGLADGKAALHTWWEVFEDPTLVRLIQRAGLGNLDLRAAFQRIEEARARRGVASGELYPGINAGADITRSRVSENVEEGPLGTRSRTDTLYSTGLDASWEIDLWGRIRRSIQSADADMQASIEDYRDVLVTLFAEVAVNYVEVRALQVQIRATSGNAKRQEETLRLVQDRFKAGIVPALDVAQAKRNLAISESIIPALQIRLYNAMNRIAVLLGEYPGEVHALLSDERAIPAPPPAVSIGLPNDLLRQRPDVRRAERLLAAQTARIGVATAELYPRLSLFGSFAFESYASNEVFDAKSRAWSFGPSVRWNLFNGGRVRSQIRVEDARANQALIEYEKALLEAVEDVEDSMNAFKREQIRMAALERAVAAARDAVRLVQDLYKNGVVDFQNVLDSERELLDRENELADSKGFVAQSLVSLYRALGGGWDPEAARKAAEAKKAAASGETDEKKPAAGEEGAGEGGASAEPAEKAESPDEAESPGTEGADTEKKNGEKRDAE